MNTYSGIPRYFDRHAHMWKKIPTKAYFVSLPIALEVPVIRELTLLAHKTLGNPSKYSIWSVTEQSTGCLVCTAPTRADAMKEAQRIILSAGDDRLRKIIRDNLSMVNKLNDARILQERAA